MNVSLLGSEMLPIWKTEDNLNIQNEHINNGLDAWQMDVLVLPSNDFQNYYSRLLPYEKAQYWQEVLDSLG